MDSSQEAILDLNPTYFCRFAARLHPRSEAIVISVQNYILTRLSWPSERAKEIYLKDDLELNALFIIPDGLDDRMTTATIYFSFLFLLDDILETLSHTEAKAFIKRMIGIMERTVEYDPDNSYESVVEDLCQRFLTSGDKTAQICGATIIKATIDFCHLAADKEQRLQSLVSTDTYVRYRETDTGALFTLKLIQWCLGIYLPDDLFESSIIKPLKSIMCRHLIFINDLYSYRREAATCGGNNFLFNAVAVIMKERNVGRQVAMDLLKDEISNAEVEFIEIVSEVKRAYSGSDRELLDRFIQACQDLMAGNWKWSVVCGRYNLTGCVE